MNRTVITPSGKLLASRILDALPQTQCTRCGYPDCAAYANAVASDQANINQCPPGGREGVALLAAITGKPALPLNPENGVEAARSVAVIDENWCIGCTLCLDACPTDAIFGSNKLMHTVITKHCTGCELCIPVCPVDCIGLENVTGDHTGWAAWSQPEAHAARKRYQDHKSRRSVPTPGDRGQLASPKGETASSPDAARKQALISAALINARKKAKNHTDSFDS